MIQNKMEYKLTFITNHQAYARV